MLSDIKDPERVAHNKHAVNERYGTGVLVGTFHDVLKALQ
jgi:hypothetical protein